MNFKASLTITDVPLPKKKLYQEPDNDFENLLFIAKLSKISPQNIFWTEFPQATIHARQETVQI